MLDEGLDMRRHTVAQQPPFDRMSTRGSGSVEGGLMGPDRCAAHVQAFVKHTMTLASPGRRKSRSGIFHGHEDVIPESSADFKNPPAQGRTRIRCVIYLYIERHIELDGDSHGPMGRELLDALVAGSPQRDERLCAPRATASRPGSSFEWHVKHIRDKRAA